MIKLSLPWELHETYHENLHNESYSHYHQLVPLTKWTAKTFGHRLHHLLYLIVLYLFKIILREITIKAKKIMNYINKIKRVLKCTDKIKRKK